jgi:putative acetyltransferase
MPSGRRWAAQAGLYKDRDGMRIRSAASEEDWDQIKGLSREYFEWISRDLGIDMSFQGIEDELESLPGAFSSQDGCVLLAESDGHLAGCVALRPLGTPICEMKRMYVRPEYRSKGIGRALGERIIGEATSRGYRVMRLDTANTMRVAQGLYSSLGFRPTQQPYDLPPDILERAVVMELALPPADEQQMAGDL